MSRDCARPVVWVTRTEPGALRTARLLEVLGYHPIVAPVLRVERTGVRLELDGVGALAFSSPNGVEAFAATHASRDLRVFAVGRMTAQVAAEAGFARVHSADGDVIALARLIVSERSSLEGRVLHAGAEEAAGDLAGMLREGGIEARSGALYRTAPCDGDLPDGYDAVLVHSPKAAGALARAARDLPPNRLWVCISPAAAEPLVRIRVGDVCAAAHPDELSMMSALRSALPV